MYTTGPLFLSVIWIEYLGGRSVGWSELERLRLLLPRPVPGDSYGMWKNVQGGSWHGSDPYVIYWMGDHLALVMLVGVALGVGLLRWVWMAYKTYGGLSRNERWAELRREQLRLRLRLQEIEREKAAWKVEQLA